MGPAGSAEQLAIHGPIARDDLPGLYRRACAALEGCRSGVLVCVVGGVPVDAATVDALARLALAARRQGCRVILRGASVELRALVDLMGLAEVLPSEPPGAAGAQGSSSRGRPNSGNSV